MIHKLKIMNKCKEIFYNCCMSSALVSKYGYISLNDAIYKTSSKLAKISTNNLPHSSRK